MLWLILFACQDTPQTQPVPPPPVSIGGDMLSREENVTIEVSLPAAAPRVWLLASTTGTATGPCRRGVCAEVDSPMILGPVAADSNGVASFSYDVPDVPMVWLQVMAIYRGQAYASGAFPTATVVELCDNGDDDDGDGLVDCEDAGCMDALVCGEQDCEDFGDDDNDGLVDCMDDDCWGRGCAGVTTRLLSGRYALRAERTTGSSVTGGNYWQSQRRGVELTDVQGSARMVTSMGASTTCTWTADTIDVFGSTYVASFFGSSYPMSAGLTPRGLAAQAGCTIPSDLLMPRDVVWFQYDPLGGVPGFGEFNSVFSSYGNRIAHDWLRPQVTFQTSGFDTTMTSPRTYSYGYGSTYMFYNFQGTNQHVQQSGDILMGPEAFQTLP